MNLPIWTELMKWFWRTPEIAFPFLTLSTLKHMPPVKKQKKIIPPQSKWFSLVASPPPLIFFHTNNRDSKTVAEANKPWIEEEMRLQGPRLAHRCNKMEMICYHLFYFNWDYHFQDFQDDCLRFIVFTKLNMSSGKDLLLHNPHCHPTNP